MKQGIKIAVLFICLCSGLPWIAGAQRTAVYGFLARCQQYYSKQQAYSFDIQYKMYESYTSDRVIEETRGSFLADKQNMLIESGSQVQLLNTKYALVVDHKAQAVLVNERKEAAITQRPSGIDSLLGMFWKSYVESETERMVTLAFEHPRASFYTVKRFTLDIEKESGMITRAVMYYAFNLSDFYEEYESRTVVPRIEISYTNYRSLHTVLPSAFSEAQFVKIDGGKLVPLAKYSNYRLIDLRKNISN